MGFYHCYFTLSTSGNKCQPTEPTFIIAKYISFKQIGVSSIEYEIV
jgi:hypothetical protein